MKKSLYGASLVVILHAASACAGAGGHPDASVSGSDDPVQALAAEVREKGWIIYAARSPKEDWDLFLCRPDGSDVRNITESPDYNEFSPLFSHDAKRVLYRRIARSEAIDDNQHGTQGVLVVAQSDGSQPTVLGQEGEFTWASWSPDGKQIACLTIKGMLFVDLETRQVVRKLPRKGFFQQVTWSPDGKWLSGVANSFGESWSIARMNAVTGEAAAVNTVDCCTPDWFPDSQQMIFSWRPRGQRANKGYGWTQLCASRQMGSRVNWCTERTVATSTAGTCLRTESMSYLPAICRRMAIRNMPGRRWD